MRLLTKFKRGKETLDSRLVCGAPYSVYTETEQLLLSVLNSLTGIPIDGPAYRQADA